MGRYNYTDNEKDLLKVFKMNQDESFSLDKGFSNLLNKADSAISSSEELLQPLECTLPQKKIHQDCEPKLSAQIKDVPPYESLVQKANRQIQSDVEFEDLLSETEFREAYSRLESINKEFSAKTSIANKTDLIFLGIATALQTAKSLLFDVVAKNFDYGNSFNPEARLNHNDKSIEQEHRAANDKFKAKHEKHRHGYWMDILYQTPPYDITKGSPAIGKNMEGKLHRIHTLGHDPVLGWIFGVANILTDTITFENFQTNCVIRKPSMLITPEKISVPVLLNESFKMVKSDYLNLPAAVFAQAAHLKFDVFTKTGLPVPVLETFNADFASTLYKSNYDALCFSRDLKIVSASAGISILIDTIIALVHGLFNENKTGKKLYEVRTRKILLISNSIASASKVIQTAITKNPKGLDIGGLFVTIFHLLTDIRFMARIKEEFTENELNKDLMQELKRLDNL